MSRGARRRRVDRSRRWARPAALLVAVLAVLLLPAGAASAADGSIAYVEAGEDGLRILVDVPAGTQADLTGVQVTLDGKELTATAESTRQGTEVRRTTVLAIDTSRSMRGKGRFTAAKEAASAYLRTVPPDVAVGIVTFDSDVEVALEPTEDRAAAQAVLEGLGLSQDTLLYDGLAAAVRSAGTLGQRTVLVLSDGADTGSETSLEDVSTLVEDTETRVHVVGLDLPADQLAPLRSIATTGKGEVITSTGDALTRTFAAQAAAVADQVLVTAPLPEAFTASVANVVVTLPTAAEPVVARALAPVEVAAAGSSAATGTPDLAIDGGWVAPAWLLWVGLGVLAVGLVTVAVLLVPPPPAPLSIADRVTAYSRYGAGPAGAARESDEKAAEPMLEQAKAAAAGVLDRNHGLNDRLTRRLAAAGSEFKPSEWLLVHVGVVLAGGVLGLLLGGGSIVVGLIFVLVGAALPPLYLRTVAGRRRKAFDNALPEVLQLLSGALSAGLSLAQAVDTVVREGPEPIASEFKRVLVEARIGVALEDAFEGVAERFNSRDFAWAVMAIRIQRQVGGNLAELLTTVAATMRERQFLRRHVRALSAEGRMSAMILCSLPPVFALYLLLTNPAFLEPLYRDPRGIVISVAGVAWLAIGVFWMSRMVKVDV
ncbi:type II secretion system F family protein [Nocardioides sp. zg-ZUI104]|uniref:type II secretion system F family protein n=1 Tax=Nocardioides faecalis TaxID=2803858 RepID=UPI001BCEE944|nr:type II secretion system F family protein [Nocardioides faecalis]MBS4752324.1 type II secretion system F family protein [Nocardioides faecalis]